MEQKIPVEKVVPLEIEWLSVFVKNLDYYWDVPRVTRDRFYFPDSSLLAHIPFSLCGYGRKGGRT